MAFSCFGKKSLDISNQSSNFFVVTAIFNPASFSSRYALYHKFAKHMEECGVQLVTIECIFPSLGQTTFQVTDPNNLFHIQVTSDSIYWMKEHLINLAVSRLPPHAQWVAWLDADITFSKRNWVELAIKELEKYCVVQLFKKAEFLGPLPQAKVLRTDYSFGYSVENNKIIDQKRYDEWYPHPGYGWAMSVQAFREIGGLPEYDIVGSGDLHFAFSLINKVSNALEDELNVEFKQFVLSQSRDTWERFNTISRSEGKRIVGFLPITIRHNWHGSRKDRQYVGRWKILIAHQFNFVRDMHRREDNGMLEFVLPENEALQQDILQHFQIRNEDNNDFGEEDLTVAKKKENAKVIFASKPRRRSSFDFEEEQRRRNLYDHSHLIGTDNGHVVNPCDPCDPCWPGDGNCPDPNNPDHGHCHSPPHGGHDNYHCGYPDGGCYDGISTSMNY